MNDSTVVSLFLKITKENENRYSEHNDENTKTNISFHVIL